MEESRQHQAKHGADVVLAPAVDEPATFEEAYMAYAPLLRMIAVGKFRIAPSDAEPLVHDVFATYLVNVDDVRNVRGYLIGGICNAARHHLRRLDAKNAIFCGEAPCAAQPAESIAAAVERKLIVRRILSRIGTRCRDILRRYYLQGESTDAMAAELNYERATIQTLLSKCRKRAHGVYRSIAEHRS